MPLLPLIFGAVVSVATAAVQLAVGAVKIGAKVAKTAAKVGIKVGKVAYKGGKKLSKGVMRTIRESRKMAGKSPQSSHIFTKPKTTSKAQQVQQVRKSSQNTETTGMPTKSHIFTKKRK